MVHVGCYVLCRVLPNLTTNMVLGMDWLHTINRRTNWYAYSLSLDCGGHTVHILGTKYSCSCANIEVCSLKSMLKLMHYDKESS